MSNETLTDTTARDAEFHVPLERVNFAPGMMLGVQATVAEQAYHQVRANRHQYWFHGVGTLFGFAVRLSPETHDDEEGDTTTRVVVSPGIGIDGLGREVMSFEPYCVNLGEWFDAQMATEAGKLLLQDGLTESNDAIVLHITMRYQSCETGLQPVMARRINAGTDPVEPSKVKDSLQLEIIPAPSPETPDIFTRPGLKQTRVFPETDLTESEKDYVDSLSLQAQRLKQLQAQMLYGITPDASGLELDDDPNDLARVLLATITVPIDTDALPTITPHINPEVIDVNNLVRPFVHTADQLAWLNDMDTETSL